MCHASRVPHPAGMHGQLDELLLHRRRWPGVSIIQKKQAPSPQAALPVPAGVRACRRLPLPPNDGPLAIRTVQHVDAPRSPHSCWESSRALRRSRATGVEHLPFLALSQIESVSPGPLSE